MNKSRRARPLEKTGTNDWSGHGGPGFEPNYAISAALSGGGVRAALFGLGSLMALRDAGKEPKDIASVSGGSITNAMVASRYYATHPTGASRQNPEPWEQATRETFDALRAGSLTKPWVIALVSYALAPLLAVPLVFIMQGSSGWLMVVPGLLVWASTLLLRGHVIEAIMGRRYLGPAWRRVTLSDLAQPADSGTQHIFCCTDLVLGMPVHFSSTGTAFRRWRNPEADLPHLADTPSGEPDVLEPLTPDGHPEDQAQAPLSSIVRASAGFPGIPPLIFKWDNSPSGAPPAPGRELPNVSFLSDGGIWNNLATEPFADSSYQLAGGRRPLYGPWVVVVADASGVVGPIKPEQLQVPGWSELKTLVRQASIQSTNTVTPRRVAFSNDSFLELRQPSLLRAYRRRLYCTVSCGDTPQGIVKRYESFFSVDDPFQYRETGLGIPQRYWNVKDRLQEMRSASATLDELETYAAGPADSGGIDVLALYPTTLGRVRADIAVGLVARGYVNTALTLYLTNLSDRIPFPSGWLGQELATRQPVTEARTPPR